MTLFYDVVAVQIPIVYTLDGDHDPDGLMYAPAAHAPLIRWVRASLTRSDADVGRPVGPDEDIPDDNRSLSLIGMHERRQWAQLVVDGLPRYERMRERLESGPDADRHLLHDLGGEADVERRPSDHDRSGRARRNPRAAAVRQNVLATVDELVAALDALTDGAVDALAPNPTVRQRWWEHWRAALPGMDAAIETRVRGLSDPVRLAGGATGLTAAHIRRLMYNDRSPGHHGPGQDRCNPLRPVPVVTPLVLRGRVGEEVHVRLENRVRGREVGFHVQGDGLGGRFSSGPFPRDGDGVRYGDGAAVGGNRSTLVSYGERHTFRLRCDREGAWPVNDLGDVRSSERGTNLHGLFGGLIVEPRGARWFDPENGDELTSSGLTTPDVDVHLSAIPADYVDLQPAHGGPCHHREFTVFLHDEPEIHSGMHVGGGEHTVMPLSYRAEPMPNRLPHRMRRLAGNTPLQRPPGQHGIDHSAVTIELDEELGEVFRVARDHDAPATEPATDAVLDHEGPFLERVAGEEQHHSSWLFGEPVTPVFRAYAGDPARVRVFHGGVKETHIFHLHVHQWRAVPEDTAGPSVNGIDAPEHGSQLLDSITIGPQTAITIDPLYGSGSRQHTLGDVIWHCHLYPHFHHGMWGLWRSFDRWVDGSRDYPDGTPCHALQPLPGRLPEGHPQNPGPAPGRLGFPWFIDATVPRKAPPPPAILEKHVGGRRRLLRMPAHSAAEYAAFATGCKLDPQPGALFVDLDGDARAWNERAGLDAPRVLHYDVEVSQSPVEYNSHGWHDRNGHHYRITRIVETVGDGEPVVHEVPPHAVEPFFPRANHGDIVELTMFNELGTIAPDAFDLRTPPVECGLHVHLVKFDVTTADGSSTGWNYLSGASCREAVAAAPTRPGDLPANAGLHRWVVDEEFGPCFFHDHLLANYRQKHGLFAALIAEPHGATWLRPDQDTVAWSGPEAVVTCPDLPRKPDGWTAFREACLAVGDFVCLHDEGGRALNPPHELSGDDDPGTMAVNYRCTPMTFREKDPSAWFSSGAGPIDTPVIRTYAGERLRIRLVQGSHEEQHGFLAHGLRWRREWHRPDSRLVDQQTLGISEAFTLDLDEAHGTGVGQGDHLWQFAALDDLWLGCWGLVRALLPGTEPTLPPLPDPDRRYPGPAPARHALPPISVPPPGSPAWHSRRAEWTAARHALDEAERHLHEARGGVGRVPAQLLDRVRAGRRAEETARRRAFPPPRPLVRPVRVGTGWSAPVQEFVVRARRTEHLHDGTALTDPWGLIYETAAGFEATEDDRGGVDRVRSVGPVITGEPLVLRARAGEWIRVVLVNEILDDDWPEDEETPLQPRFGPEPHPPRVPLEHLDDLGHPDQRHVSPRVSLHPGLLLYDVVAHDGSWVGHNHDGTAGSLVRLDRIGHGGGGEGHGGGDVVFRDEHGTSTHRDRNWQEYWWYADPALAPGGHEHSPGQVCLLRDEADVRNHRHHGLVGALVVLPADATPVRPKLDENGDAVHPPADEVAWTGGSVEIVAGVHGDRSRIEVEPGRTHQHGAADIAVRHRIASESVLIVQDGLRLFVAGNPESPMRDVVVGDDPEDAGQKAISYRTGMVHPSTMLAVPEPASPTVPATAGRPLWLRVVCASDKPRNHTFTLHDLAWPAAPWLGHRSPWTGALNGLTTGTVHDLVLHPEHPGDHAYRSGAFRWAVENGVWGIIRVE